MRIEEVIDHIFHELKAAEEKHPGFPQDPVYMAAIMAEEAGESVQAALDIVMKGVDKDYVKFKKEVSQTGAMEIRILLSL